MVRCRVVPSAERRWAPASAEQMFDIGGGRYAPGKTGEQMNDWAKTDRSRQPGLVMTSHAGRLLLVSGTRR